MNIWQKRAPGVLLCLAVALLAWFLVELAPALEIVGSAVLAILFGMVPVSYTHLGGAPAGAAEGADRGGGPGGLHLLHRPGGGQLAGGHPHRRVPGGDRPGGARGTGRRRQRPGTTITSKEISCK